MKKIVIGIMGLLLSGGMSAQEKALHSGYPIDPVPFTSVKVTDNFWGQRMKASREVTIPLAFSKCETEGRYENFVKAANPSEDNKAPGFTFDESQRGQQSARLHL